MDYRHCGDGNAVDRPMRQKERSSPAQTRLRPEAEELDEINGKTLARKNAAEAIRRTLEAQIEARAKRRRSRELPASSGLRNKA
jgi:hypothetical protein